MSEDFGHPRMVGLNVHAKAWNGEPSSMEEPKTICTFFAMGGCRKGSGCPYSHDLTQEAPAGVDASGGFYISGRVANLNNAPAMPQSASTPSFRQLSPTTSTPPMSMLNPGDRMPPYGSVQGEGQMMQDKGGNSGYGFAPTGNGPPPSQQQMPQSHPQPASAYDVAQQQQQQQQQQQMYGGFVGSSVTPAQGRPDFEQQQYFQPMVYAPQQQQQQGPSPQEMQWQSSMAPQQQQGMVSIGFHQQPVAGYEVGGQQVLYMAQGQPQPPNGLRMSSQPPQAQYEQQWVPSGAGQQQQQQQPQGSVQQSVKYVSMPASSQRQQTPLSSAPLSSFATAPTGNNGGGGFVSYAASGAAFGRGDANGISHASTSSGGGGGGGSFQVAQSPFPQQTYPSFAQGSQQPQQQQQFTTAAFKNQHPLMSTQSTYQPYPQPHQQQQQQQQQQHTPPVSPGYAPQMGASSFSQQQQQQAAFFNNEFITSNYMTSQPQQQQFGGGGAPVMVDYGASQGGLPLDMVVQLSQISLQEGGGGGMQPPSQLMLQQPQQQQQQQPQQQWNAGGGGASGGPTGAPFLPPSSSFSTSTLFRSSDLFPPVPTPPVAGAPGGGGSLQPMSVESRPAPQFPRSIDSDDSPQPPRRQGIPAAPMPLQ